VGTMGPGRGVSGARRGLRHEGAVREDERGRELLEKRRGDECVFIPGEGPGWRMSSPHWNAADGEGGHGAAKPDGVIHRYVPNFFINAIST
jgi:hypothetical protein